MSDAHADEYGDAMVTMLELIWGEGYMSPGGPQSVRDIVAGVDLADKLVLDIGCGLGGVDIMLARDHYRPRLPDYRPRHRGAVD